MSVTVYMYIIKNKLIFKLKNTITLNKCTTTKRYKLYKGQTRQTAMPQRLYSVLKTCQRAVGSSRYTPKTSNVPVLTASYSVHTRFPQRLYSVHHASTACEKLLPPVHGAKMVRSQRAHSAHTARIQCLLGNHRVFTRISYFKQPNFANKVIFINFSKQFLIVFNSC